MPTSTSDGEILTIKQVADYLKVTERTIYRLAAAKKIPAFKVERFDEHLSTLKRKSKESDDGKKTR
jgi:excisionase family DNA binding protein